MAGGVGVGRLGPQHGLYHRDCGPDRTELSLSAHPRSIARPVRATTTESPLPAGFAAGDSDARAYLQNAGLSQPGRYLY